MQDIYKSIYEQNITNEVKVFGHEESLISVGPHPAGDGHKLLYKFPNGYGASVGRFQVVLKIPRNVGRLQTTKTPNLGVFVIIFEIYLLLIQSF